MSAEGDAAAREEHEAEWDGLARFLLALANDRCEQWALAGPEGANRIAEYAEMVKRERDHVRLLTDEVDRLRLALAGHEQIAALIEELWPQDGPYVVAEVLTRARAAQLPPELREEARWLADDSSNYRWEHSVRNTLRRIAAIGEEKP